MRSLVDNLDDIRAVAESIDVDDSKKDMLAAMATIAKWAREGLEHIAISSLPR